MSRITNDLFDIGELAHHGPEDFFIAIMTFVGAFWIMFTINFKLALIILIIVPILIALIAYSNIKMRSAWRKMYHDISRDRKNTGLNSSHVAISDAVFF